MSRACALLCLALAACGGATSTQPHGNPPADPVTTESGEHLYRQGIALAAGGDLVRAEQYIAASIARGYPEDRAIGPLVRVCVAASRLRQALGYAEPYLEQHPSVWQLRFLVASILRGLGQDTRARDELTRVVHDAPDEAEPHYQLACALREVDGNEVGARAEYERYLALAPEGRHAEEARGVLAGEPPPPDHAAATATTGHTIERVEGPTPAGGD